MAQTRYHVILYILAHSIWLAVVRDMSRAHCALAPPGCSVLLTLPVFPQPQLIGGSGRRGGGGNTHVQPLHSWPAHYGMAWHEMRMSSLISLQIEEWGFQRIWVFSLVGAWTGKYLKNKSVRMAPKWMPRNRSHKGSGKNLQSQVDLWTTVSVATVQLCHRSQ